jgi:predicted Rossmann fold flavoprotein
MKFDAIIIGGGAAGLFCAMEAGKRGRKVLLIEHNAQIGRKILISGGGRCNFTNLDVRAENFVSNNPHFCKSALARYTPEDFVGLVKKHKIKFYEKTLGQLFCRERSQQIVEMLLAECEQRDVKILTDCSARQIAKKNGLFEIETNRGSFKGENLVIATGGLSFPKIGATGFGYDIAKQFGIKLTKTRPSLVPLVFAKGKNYKQLAGVSVDSVAETGKATFRENILFTHRGLSGPAVLQISNYWKKDKPINFDLLPELDAIDLFEKNQDSKQTLVNFLGNYLPKRFAETFTSHNFQNKPINQLSKKEIEKIAETLNNWRVLFSETEGWHKAEVTLGGVDTNEISSQTMESKKIAGLYFIGEVLDVTGWLGGYNFQWAWSSGFACGNSI